MQYAIRMVPGLALLLMAANRESTWKYLDEQTMKGGEK